MMGNDQAAAAMAALTNHHPCNLSPHTSILVADAGDERSRSLFLLFHVVSERLGSVREEARQTVTDRLRQ